MPFGEKRRSFGVTALITVVDTTVKLRGYAAEAHGVTCNNPLPVIFTIVPSAAGPLVGLRLQKKGGGDIPSS